jgi:glutamate-ammonia-ligase adenylyltransferase
VTGSFEGRLARVLEGTALLEQLPVVAASFLEQRAKDPAVERLDGPVLEGLARVLATSPEAASYLSRRPALLERIADAGPDLLKLPEAPAGWPEPSDLETSLDELRIARRDATVIAACADLGGVTPFEEVSAFLSLVAERTVQQALGMAESLQRGTAGGLGVIGMGKIAGRELTYHSDLDLIFLYRGDGPDLQIPSRVAQRLIAYLSTMTGAGVAYAVDSRLRPSGRQGALVTNFSAFEDYQRERAAAWEHMALMRARAIAGEIEAAERHLEAVRAVVRTRGVDPWPGVAHMRQRVEAERGAETQNRIQFKTGRGGIMDVEFLAAGALLESSGTPGEPDWPSVPDMLRHVVRGTRVERLLEGYRFLRLVEARVRWLAGRPVDHFSTAGDVPRLVADLLEPELGPEGLLRRLAEIREATRAAYDEAVGAGSIRALERS